MKTRASGGPMPVAARAGLAGWSRRAAAPGLRSLVAIGLAAIAVVGGAVAHANEALTAAAARDRYTLQAEPEGVLSIAAAQELLGKTPGKPQAVAIAGRVGTRQGSPFLEGKASFFLIEIVDDPHASKPGHDSDDCPFCKKRLAKLPIAAVQFVDAAGAVLPHDSRGLFGLEKGREVVVRGTGIFDPKFPIPVVQLTADGIHVRAKR
jgi:hypothetical protein